MLWNRSLVMYDQETDSLWSHLLGQAMRGKLKGKQLEQIPSVITDWSSWNETHPDSTVLWLSRTSRNFRRSFHRNSHLFVLGIVHDRQPYAWSVPFIARKGVINDQLGRASVVVAYDASSFTSRLFSRVVDGQELTFSAVDGVLVDDQTMTRWHPVTGISISGELKGTHLQPLPAILSFRQAWLEFHPTSKIVTPQNTSQP